MPTQNLKNICTQVIARIGEFWIAGNDLNMKLMQRFQWDIRGLEGLDRMKSYLICANHQSWTDIVVLQHVFNRRIPFIRFFLKQQLMYIPFLGLAWWGLDFPFMKRYSKEYREKHPEKKNRDLEVTRRACEKFRNMPVSILNFLEGTRFTTSKHEQQHSIYKNLLMPRAGGLAFVIGSMGEQFESLLDVTIVYPQGVKTIWQMFTGELTQYVVHIKQLPLPKHFFSKDYSEDANFRADFQKWVTQIWEAKDREIQELLQGHEPLAFGAGIE